MTEFLSEWHILGLVIGLATFLIIGLFHPLVIKGYYYFGLRCRPWFALAGIGFIILSLLFDNVVVSVLSGVVAFSSFWSILEVTEQAERVRKGWFPKGPAQLRDNADAGSHQPRNDGKNDSE